MTLTDYIRTVRFPAELDAIEEAFGEVPEELMTCLRKGAIVEAMEAKAKAGGNQLRYGGLSRYDVGEEMCGWFFDSPDLNAGFKHAEGENAIFALFTEGTDFITKYESGAVA